MTKPLCILLASLMCAGAAQAIVPVFVTDEVTAEADPRKLAALDILVDDLSLLSAAYRGRMAILDTVAREQLGRMHGSTDIDGLPPIVAYLDVFFRTGAYLDRPMVYVRSASLRRRIAAGLPGEHRAEFERTRRLPPLALMLAKARRGAVEPETDVPPGHASLFLTAKLPEGQELLFSHRARYGDFACSSRIEAYAAAIEGLELGPEDRIPIERLEDRYTSFLAIDVFRAVPGRYKWHDAHATLVTEGPDAAPPAGSNAWGALRAWRDMKWAWRRADPAGVRQALDRLAEAQQRAGAPPLVRRRAERWYNRLWKLGAAWIAFAAAFLVTLAAVASGRRCLRVSGLALLALATLACAAGFAVRWVLSGRAWYLPPVTNQFEGLFASAMLAGLFAFVAELIWRRGVFALAGSLYATVALLGGLVLLGPVSTGIGQAPGILHTPLLTAHVSVIIAGNALVGMTGVISLIYLAVRAWALLRGRSGAADAPDPPGMALSPPAAIDRCNLITAQLALWAVLIGTVLGAVWADTAWGRFWGWDAKETWSLLTVLVYLIVLHLRLVMPARRRGLVTAAGCLLACGVMVFNWIVVNYLMTGKHSYA